MRNFKDLIEARDDIAAFTLGRFNPPTTGHEKLITKLDSVAKKNSSSMYVFPTHTKDAARNPLPHNLKVAYMKKMYKKYAKNIQISKARNVFEVAKLLYDKGHKSVIMVVGSDRVTEFTKLLDTYNGVKSTHGFYEFENIQVLSAGERDPDAEDISGMSASKMRAAAADGDKDSFLQGVPSSFKDGDKLYRDVRKYMGIREERDMGDMTDFEAIRDAYLTGKIWNVDDIVESKGISGKVVRKGTNYLSFVDEEGKVHKAWLHDISIDEARMSALDKLKKFDRNRIGGAKIFKDRGVEFIRMSKKGQKTIMNVPADEFDKWTKKGYEIVEDVDLDEDASVYKKTATKAKNKEGTIYAFGRDKKLDGQPEEKGGYIVWKLSQNYAGHVRGGISKKWVYVKKDLAYSDAVKLMNKRLKYKAFNEEAELDEALPIQVTVKDKSGKTHTISTIDLRGATHALLIHYKEIPAVKGNLPGSKESKPPKTDIHLGTEQKLAKQAKHLLKKHPAAKFAVGAEAIKLTQKMVTGGTLGEELDLDERNYAKEYANYHGKPEQIARRSSRNKARRAMGDKVKTGMDVGHKDNDPLNNDPDNLRNEDPSKNRKEPRLREEELSGAEKEKMKDYEKKIPKKDFIDKYGKEEGERIYYATITNMAKKEAVKQVDEENPFEFIMKKLDLMRHPKEYEAIVKTYVKKMKATSPAGGAWQTKSKETPSYILDKIVQQYKGVKFKTARDYLNKLIKKGVLPKELAAEYHGEKMVREWYESETIREFYQEKYGDSWWEMFDEVHNRMVVKLGIGEDEFKPHMMYDPKTGKEYKADTYDDHIRMKKIGYVHEKPKMKENRIISFTNFRTSNKNNHL